LAVVSTGSVGDRRNAEVRGLAVLAINGAS